MPTPHNAAEVTDIAKVVLMPGDPLRAQFVAENYLENATLFTSVRNMLGFTGSYHGIPISVMGSGMGIPSMSIYAYELFNLYDVDAVIRVGSAGGISPQVKLRDIVFGQGACTDSNFGAHYGAPGTLAPICDFDLLRSAVDVAERMGVPYHVGNLISTDTFYRKPEAHEPWRSMGVLATEMEAAGLYLNAMAAGKKALAIVTVSDMVLTNDCLTAEERETTLTQMIEVALEVAKEEQSNRGRARERME